MTNESDTNEINDIDCLEAFDYLYAYVNGELKEPKELAAIEHHIGHCMSCFSRSQIEGELNKRLKNAGRDKTPDTLKNKMLKLLENI